MLFTPRLITKIRINKNFYVKIEEIDLEKNARSSAFERKKGYGDLDGHIWLGKCSKISNPQNMGAYSTDTGIEILCISNNFVGNFEKKSSEKNMNGNLFQLSGYHLQSNPPNYHQSHNHHGPSHHHHNQNNHSGFNHRRTAPTSTITSASFRFGFQNFF